MSDTGRRRHGLGRGLDALFGDSPATREPEPDLSSARTVPIDLLVPNPFQPRRSFDEAALEGLAESIRAQGIIQPILVRRRADTPEHYEIVAGERRWRAAQQAQLHDVPVVVREVSDTEALQLALIENVQRQDLGPLEEAEGYHRLIAEFGHTQEVLGRAVGKSRSHIANTIRLRELPDPVKALVNDGKLSAGHARALLGAGDPVALAERIVDKGLTVRDVEAAVRQESAVATGETGAPARQAPRRRAKGPAQAEPDPNTVALEEEASSVLGLKVSIKETGRQSGTLTIHYGTLDQLDDVLRRLGIET
ncbi:MAG: ParB/RepB/Spo0J family partition protein [Alphaproteobacteria bacterium]|jgi:ParB family chromosome partitioning protein|nr:ParB/RepB/Spo0J family partition protein [Alphaproteobacteria bacterium]